MAAYVFFLVFPSLPSICPSITCFRRQFLRKMWPTQLAFLLFIVFRGLFYFLHLHFHTILSALAAFKPLIRCTSTVDVVWTIRPCLSVLYLGTVPTWNVLASYGFRWPAAFPQGYVCSTRSYPHAPSHQPMQHQAFASPLTQCYVGWWC